MVHRRGSVWHAVRASASIPGVFPPFFTPDGKMLVDSSARVLREMAGSSPVITRVSMGRSLRILIQVADNHRMRILMMAPGYYEIMVPGILK
jgi:predicted acylesterase/phospholipase RssA